MCSDYNAWTMEWKIQSSNLGYGEIRSPIFMNNLLEHLTWVFDYLAHKNKW